MKNIIILGEEYWFEKKGTLFVEAKALLNYLDINKDNRFNYVILKHPSLLIDQINYLKEENIKAIFLFQDVLSDAYLNNKTIYEMKQYLNSLKNIFIYPPVEIIDTFGSKKYNLTLNNQLPEAQLPYTEVLKYPNYIPYKDDNMILTYLFKISNKLLQKFEKIVIKKGYSYEGKQVITITKNDIDTFNNFRYKANRLNFKNFWGIKQDSKNIDKNIDRYYIIQGYNKIITNRKNEYRVFFYNGEPKYIAHGDSLANYCIINNDSELVNKIILFAKDVFTKYIKIIWKLDRLPILFRIDVSFAVDPLFQDKHTIKIDNFKDPIRLYVNEMEIDPTSFFYNKFTCKNNDKFSSEEMQIEMAKYLTEYINSLD